MKLQIYTLYDKKMGTYMRPMFVEHLVQIQRDLLKVLSEKKNSIAEFPTDFELYKLGEYDQTNATMSLNEKPEFILNINELVEGDK